MRATFGDAKNLENTPIHRAKSPKVALLPAYRLKLYRNFKAIEAADYLGLVRYYERFEDDIRALYFEEYFDCTVTYANALFETGAFGKYLVMADHLLETVIMQNIETWGGEDIYAQLLFKKSAALYNLMRYTEAEHILRELVKLDPWARLPLRFLRTCLWRQKPAWVARARAASLCLLLLAALLVAGAIFAVRPYFPEWLAAAKSIYIVVFAAGTLVLGGSETLHAWQCWKTAHAFAAEHRCRKRGF